MEKTIKNRLNNLTPIKTFTPSPKKFFLLSTFVCAISLPISHALASDFSNAVPPLKLEAEPSPHDPNIFIKVSQKVIPSVVNISTEIDSNPTSSQQNPFGFAPQPRNPFGYPPFPGQLIPPPKKRALGTGAIIEVKDKELIVLTNYHVIDQATKINISFDQSTEKNPKEHKAEILGLDKAMDLALLKVPVKDSSKYKALKFGSSDKLQIGQYVVAVGNPYGQGHSVTHGIVSAKGRSAPTIGKYIQTDAPINPGNSGGPLVNLKGEIVGINNAILAQAQGIGFAIPSDEVIKLIPQLEKGGKIQRGFIGIHIGQIPEYATQFSQNEITPGQPYIADVINDGPAQKAGAQVNDIILSFAGEPVKTPLELKKAVMSKMANSQVPMTILRKGKKLTLNIKLGTI